MFEVNLTFNPQASYNKWKETMDTSEGERSARNMTNLLDLEQVQTEWMSAGYTEGYVIYLSVAYSLPAAGPLRGFRAPP